MIKRIVFIASVAALLLSSQAVSADAPTVTVGNSSPWGHWLLYHTAPDIVHNPIVRVVWAQGDTSVHIYCGVTSHTPNVAVPSDWVPAYNPVPPATDFALTCDTRDVLFSTLAEPQIINGYIVPNGQPPPR